MSTQLENALDQYSRAHQELNDHIAANPEIFKQHQNIINRMIDAENNLRDIVATEKAPVSNGSFRVTVTPMDIEQCDIELLKQRFPEAAAATVTKQVRPPRITIGKQPNT